MARVSTYLIFPGNTEEAFEFYKSVFGGEFEGGISRMGDIPLQDGQEPVAEENANYVVHVTLPILGGHLLMGTDAVLGMGKEVVMGTNVNINLEPDTREELDTLFTKLSEGGRVEMAPEVAFWGDYFAACVDRFGVCWMLNTSASA